jgi:phage baseplate assembly protein W
MVNNIDNNFLIDLHHDGDFSSGKTGDLKTIAGRANLRQAILNRLITVKGSIVHRPDYGVGLKLFQGALSTVEKQRELSLLIQAQLTEDPRIESVDSVKFEADTDFRTGTFSVKVKITAAGIGEIEETISPFNQ